ncbi:non-hydrolyzing UDP-N-acetylglucosamine 2-epimerase [Lacimicrobium alkaliphilum]|uniref:UDP-N-acetyl glucosamine 2-epimerase n=1 Tax=Lacimicrobium alkaliphilum TaxID=1526571 RepID=A0A0U3ADB3_9ALTE|nr:UDP-N-acetylglucosamine 2-epimerase (non-hydrolyzing) [Lacimicrobium alkaliphilum]ALS99054.1 UDP-N-acetyl glucosamine 2-epimerase [Lacimicrobium alkaliphilum]
MKILTVIGARPQFVKASVVSRAILELTQDQPGQVTETILHTGQHFDSNMSQLFFDQLGIPTPKINLNIHSSSHGQMTGQMLIEIEKHLLQEKPDWVLVYGDTNSTLAGALAAAKLHIPIAHVEAGLRSFNKSMPEEINRVMTDHVASSLLCPTEAAMKNLEREALSNKSLLVGDVMYDAFLYAKKKSEQHSSVEIEGLDAGFILATLHRAENTDSLERLKDILMGLNQINLKKRVLLPLHPRTKKQISHFGLEDLLKDILVSPPLGYIEMVQLLSLCECVITDSGGLQKEAYFAKKPCLTVRDETEWIETVDAGWNHLVSASSHQIISQYDALDTPNEWKPLYGHGDAGATIVRHLLDGQK